MYPGCTIGEGMGLSKPCLVELKGITKSFPGVLANDKIDLSVAKGEIHALLGENGAGKSTLMNILYGLYEADAGTIYVRGRRASISSPKDAIALGIGMVHQEFMLIPALTVVENVALGMHSTKEPFTDLDKVRKKLEELAKTYNFKIRLDAKIADLGVGEQQRVEILKALYRGAEVLILDEPTAVLTPQETRELFATLRLLVAEGKSVVFISHKLNEVMEISHRITVLRSGKVIGTVLAKDTTKEELARMMVGRSVAFEVERGTAKTGQAVLEVKDLVVKDVRGLNVVNGATFDVRAGEILGVAGVDGNGQEELVEAIAGMRRISDGAVRIGGRDIAGLSPRQVASMGVAHIPASRHKTGLILDMTVAENLILQSQYRSPFSRGGNLDFKIIRDTAKNLMKEFDIRAPNEDTRVRLLSGGNQQKVILARELARKPKVLLAVHPTRGLDVGATEYIRRKIVEARNSGCAVLLVSTELDEILNLSDRIAVMYEGQIMGIVDARDAEIEKLGLMMAGSLRLAG